MYAQVVTTLQLSYKYKRLHLCVCLVRVLNHTCILIQCCYKLIIKYFHSTFYTTSIPQNISQLYFPTIAPCGTTVCRIKLSPGCIILQTVFTTALCTRNLKGYICVWTPYYCSVLYNRAYHYLIASIFGCSGARGNISLKESSRCVGFADGMFNML